jgi:hypothetical protein
MSKVPETSDNMKLCICQICPTYKKCNLTEGFSAPKAKPKKKQKKKAASAVTAVYMPNTT